MRFVLDIKNNNSFKTWLIISLISIIFSIIYESFSFGVISMNMVLLFLYPLLLGVLPSIFIKRDLGRLYNDGVLSLLFASMLNGIFDIYGTSSIYPKYMIIMGIALILIQLILNKRKEYSNDYSNI